MEKLKIKEGISPTITKGGHMDFQDIKGQEHVKRGLEVALSGNHGVLLVSASDNPDVPKLIKATAGINAVLPIYTTTPCKCGYFADPARDCNCTPSIIQDHLVKEIKRLPMDRIHIHLEVPRLKAELLGDKRRGENTDTIITRIKRLPIFRPSVLDKEAEELIKLVILELGISAMAYDKICEVSATIAQMDNKEKIESHHISEATSYRSLDRNLWG